MVVLCLCVRGAPAGPGCVLQSCIIQRGAKIGAGAVIMEGALVEEFAEVAPGSVVHPGRRIPKGQVLIHSYTLTSLLPLSLSFSIYFTIVDSLHD